MTPDNDPARIAAQRWFGTHRAEHLDRDCDRMVDRCAMFLIDSLTMTNATAQAVAREALADLEGGNAPGFVDIERSSSRMVVLRDSEAGTSHMVSLPELFQLVRSRRLSSAD